MYAETAMGEMIKNVSMMPHVIKMILHGSQVENYNEGDIDLIIIIDDGKCPISTYINVNGIVEYKTDIIVDTISDYNRNASITGTPEYFALKNGKTIYARSNADGLVNTRNVKHLNQAIYWITKAANMSLVISKMEISEKDIAKFICRKSFESILYSVKGMLACKNIKYDFIRDVGEMYKLLNEIPQYDLSKVMKYRVAIGGFEETFDATIKDAEEAGKLTRNVLSEATEMRKKTVIDSWDEDVTDAFRNIIKEVKEYNPVKVFLYGSYACDDFGKRSTARLLIITDEIKNVKLLSKLRLEINTSTVDEFNKLKYVTGTIENLAIEEGITLYERADANVFIKAGQRPHMDDVKEYWSNVSKESLEKVNEILGDFCIVTSIKASLRSILVDNSVDYELTNDVKILNRLWHNDERLEKMPFWYMFDKNDAKLYLGIAKDLYEQIKFKQKPVPYLQDME